MLTVLRVKNVLPVDIYHNVQIEHRPATSTVSLLLIAVQQFGISAAQPRGPFSCSVGPFQSFRRGCLQLEVL